MSQVACPHCGSTDTGDYMWGLVEVVGDSTGGIDEKRIRFGGCIVSDDDPEHFCNDCGKDFSTTPNIYLDIDGVLLANDLTPARHAKEFLQKVIDLYPRTTFWLTTHCQGDADVPIQHIGHLFDEETVGLMKFIKPTSWETAKTRAIDFSRPFLWFDDDLFYEEKQTLLEHDVFDNLITVDLKKDPDQLGKFVTSFPLPVS